MSECESLIKEILSSVSNSPSWESWFQFSLTFLAILVALFGRELVAWLKRPELKLEFDINNQSFFHDQYFPFKIPNNNTPHYTKGKNCLLKISNPIKRRFFLKSESAKGVVAKVSYVYENQNKFTYHPTNLNWSGGRGEKPIDIISGSHHFLDFINIQNYQNDYWINDPENLDEMKISAIKPNEGPSVHQNNRINFRLWVVGDYGGLPKMFCADENYSIHFVLNGENCGPYKFTASIKWEKSKWDKPDIKIRKEK